MYIFFYFRKNKQHERDKYHFQNIYYQLVNQLLIQNQQADSAVASINPTMKSLKIQPNGNTLKVKTVLRKLIRIQLQC